METNEIMTNEEVTEVTDVSVESMPETSENGVGVGIAIGAAFALVGTAAYKYIAKPLVAKIRAKKEQKQAEEAETNEIEIDVKAEDVE